MIPDVARSSPELGPAGLGCRGDVLSVAFEHAPDDQAILAHEPDDRFSVVAVNRRLREHLAQHGVNASAEALVGLDWPTVLRAAGLAESHVQAALDHCRAVLRGEPSPEYLGTVLVGSRSFHVEGQVVALATPGVRRHLLWMFRDVTTRVEAEQALRHRERQLRQAKRLGRLAHWDYDLRTGATEWSPEMYEILGIAPATPPSVQAYLAALPEEIRERSTADFQHALSERTPHYVLHRLRAEDGRTDRWVECRWELEYDEAQRPIHVSGTLQDVTARTQAEAELRESYAANRELNAMRRRAEAEAEATESRYRLLFDHGPAALGIADTTGRLISMNPAFEAMLDAGTGEPRRPTARLAAIENGIAELLRGARASGGYPTDRELTCTVAEGRRFHAVLRLRPIHLGHSPALLVTAQDVSEQRRREAALRILSSGLTRESGPAFFGQLAVTICDLLDADACIIGMLSDGGDRVRTVGVCVDGESRPATEIDLAGTPCEAVLKSLDGFILTNRASEEYPNVPALTRLGASGFASIALRRQGGLPLGSISVLSRRPYAPALEIETLLRLIAVRTAAEMQRQREERRFHDLFEFSPDAILMVNESGHIVLANPMAEAMLGYDSGDLCGLSVEMLVPEPQRAQHAAMRVRQFALGTSRTLGSRGRPLTVVRKDGSQFPADISLSPVRSDNDPLMAVVIRDVSERVRHEEERTSLEAQLRHAQKMDAIGRLSGSIAHDFNNLLAVMVGNLALARLDVNAQHPAAKSLEAIDIATERARQLVNQILAFSRPSRSPRVVVAPADVAHEAVRLLRATSPKRVSITAHIMPDLPNVLADATQLHQVLMNLGTNAWQAMGRRAGEVTIELDAVTLTEDAAAGHPGPGHYVRMRVSDTGTGMSQDVIDRIFEPFFTTKSTGTGLGLSVVHGIVHEHGGSLSVSSRVGAGTTMTVLLPATTENAGTAPDVALPGPANGGTVALIDDEPAVLQMTQRMLERLGYQPVAFDKPATFLDVLRSEPDLFDLVLTDCNMPVVSGVELAQEAVRIAPELIIVLMSGFTDVTPEEIRSAGIRSRLQKPFTLHELDRALRDAVAGRPDRA